MLWKASPRKADDKLEVRIAMLEKDIHSLQSSVAANKSTIGRVHARIDGLAVKVNHTAGFIAAISLAVAIIGHFVK